MLNFSGAVSDSLNLILLSLQAQTVANFHLANDQGLRLVPVINKIDLPAAEPARVSREVGRVLDGTKGHGLMQAPDTRYTWQYKYK